jgi:PAS domain S-box-containing protein
MDMDSRSATAREISCRVTRTLILYVREMKGSPGNLLDGLELDEAYLTDTNNWVSHAFLQTLYGRMIGQLGDENAVYKMALASGRHESLGLLNWIGRLLGNPKLLYAQAPRYNRLLKANGDVYIREAGDTWVVLEDRYHDGAVKTRYDCDYTRGILAGIPTVFDMPLARVEEIECQVPAGVYGERFWPDSPPQDARGCLYRIRWEAAARPPLWKRLFQRYSVYRRAIDDLLEANRLIQERYAEAQRLAQALEAANRRLTESRHQLEGSLADLRASEERYRLLADHVSDVIWILDLASLRFTYVSPAVERMRGYTAAEAMAMNLEEVLAPESLAAVSQALAAELAREGQADADPSRAMTLEILQSCKDGVNRWAEVNASFLRDASGRATAILGVTRDISERKRAEQLVQGKLTAEAANAAKTEFLSHMSHELRTPLNHIMGFTELILAKHFGDLNQLQEEYLADVYQSSQHLLALVNEVLDVAKIEAGKLELHLAPFSLKPLLASSLSMVTDAALEKGVRLATRIDPLPGTIVADEIRVRQILYNLLANAVKFTDRDGLIVLGARMRGPQAETSAGEGIPGGEIEVSVQDSGIGIPPADLERIFEPFSRLETSLSRKFPGTGLGLTLARNLVHLHGGRLWGESGGPGTGATFRFTLPLAGREPPPPAGRPVPDSAGATPARSGH